METIQLTIVPTSPPPPSCPPGEVLECNIGGDPNACACFATRFPSCVVSVRYHPTDPGQVFVSQPTPGCEEALALALALLAARLMTP